MTPDPPAPVSVTPEQQKKKPSPGIPRSPNWSLNEIRILCSYIRENYVRILGSHNDGPGKNAKRQRHWEKVTEMINEQSGQTRVWKQVRKKWVDLTYMVKSYKRTNPDGDMEQAIDDENMTPVIKEVLSAMNAQNISSQPSSSNEDENIEISSITKKSSPPPFYNCESDSDEVDEDDDDEKSTTPVQLNRIKHKLKAPNDDVKSKIRKKMRMKVHRTYRMPANRRGCGIDQQNVVRKKTTVSVPTESPNERIRYRGPHRRFNPYTNCSTSTPIDWSKRFSSSMGNILQNTDEQEKQIRGNATSLYEMGNDFQKQMFELEKEKVLTERAKLSVMQDRLELGRKQFELDKNILFCLQKISHSLDNGFPTNYPNLLERRYQMNQEGRDVNSYWAMRNMKNL